LLRFERTLLAVACLAVACSGSDLEVLTAPQEEQPAPSGFITAQGDQLLLDGAPYRFVSFNAFTLTGCGNADERYDNASIHAFFASLRPQSMVRTYAFRTNDVASIDAVVASAARHGHFLNLVLTDANGSCGDDGTKKTAAWYEGDFRDEYLPWLREITALYASEPAVAMWELVSSPVEVPAATLRAFYDEVGGVVHELAPHQLVSSGTHGVWAYGEVQGYALIHESPGIDVAGFRDYDQNEGLPPNLEPALFALAGRKPLVLAEAGVYASPEGDPSMVLNERVCVSWQTRRDVLASWIESASATPLAGINVWNYLPVADDGCSFTTHTSDPLFELIRDSALE
jgi:hypothetical protein